MRTVIVWLEYFRWYSQIPGCFCLPSGLGGLLSAGSELMELEGTDLELSSRLLKKKKKSVFCVVFSHIILRCERWSVLHADEEWDWETSYTDRN